MNNTKQCRVCNLCKKLEEFPTRSGSPDGRRSECRVCHRDIRREYESRYREGDKSQSYRQEYRAKNAEFLADYQREYLKKPDKRERKKIWARNYARILLLDPTYRLSRNVSRRMRQYLMKGKDNKHWEKLAGYTVQQLMAHLEKKFVQGMSWDNYGEWQIDHIRPISSFNFASYDCDEFKQCWALSNLQPLWKIDNIRKGNHWTQHLQGVLDADISTSPEQAYWGDFI